MGWCLGYGIDRPGSVVAELDNDVGLWTVETARKEKRGGRQRGGRRFPNFFPSCPACPGSIQQPTRTASTICAWEGGAASDGRRRRFRRGEIAVRGREARRVHRASATGRQRTLARMAPLVLPERRRPEHDGLGWLINFAAYHLSPA
jgi:hypothetical protein